ncbi:histidine kinase, partial [Curtobacterium sp. CT11-133]|uniref:histidine kinase n=1 Tax=Curtobacterium sp. CT11-133 TaxID=3243014 RepID=UPI0039B0A3E4
EREHLARELHDELGALLTAAKLDITRIKARLSGENGDLPARIEHLIETLNSGIALKRRIIEDLRPSSLSNLGLLPALEILTREFAQRSGLS